MDAQPQLLEYHHQPLLPGKHVRILLLYPNGDIDAPIHCSLLQMSLDRLAVNGPAYDAVSYVWGPDIRDHKVFCDGREILVTKNCHAALRYFRLSAQSRRLWIDAVCIDQSSMVEKSHQVSLMGDVYKLAHRVLIWLCEGDKQIYKSMRRARRVARCLGYFSIIDSSRLTINPGFLVAILNRVFQPLALTGVPMDWFTRAWTAQELVLAREPILRCGPEYLPWDSINTWFNQHCGTEVGAVNSFLLRDAYRRFQPGQKIRVNCQKQKPHSQKTSASFMSQMIAATAACRQASHDQDVIFSLYGLMLDIGVRLPPPDYDQRLSAIFEEFTVANIRYSNNLGLFSTLSSHFGQPGFPSWVPSFIAREGSVIVSPEYDRARFRPTFQLWHQPGLITLEGIKVDTITKATFQLEQKPLGELNDTQAKRVQQLGLAYWLDHVFNMFGLDHKCPNGDKTVAGIMNSIITTAHVPEEFQDEYTGTMFDGPPYFRFSARMDDELLEAMARTLRAVSNMIGQQMQKENVTAKVATRLLAEQELPLSEDCLEMLSTIRAICFGWLGLKMRVIATQSGCMGFGEGDYMIGDEVVFLFGCVAPCVVRRCGAEYRFVGKVGLEGMPEGHWPPSEESSEVELFKLA
ncbi:hypothetical protein OQA88_13711 [Cercophora sp. LCS_1]